jgi:hypothetical protein
MRFPPGPVAGGGAARSARHAVRTVGPGSRSATTSTGCWSTLPGRRARRGGARAHAPPATHRPLQPEGGVLLLYLAERPAGACRPCDRLRRQRAREVTACPGEREHPGLDLLALGRGGAQVLDRALRHRSVGLQGPGDLLRSRRHLPVTRPTRPLQSHRLLSLSDWGQLPPAQVLLPGAKGRQAESMGGRCRYPCARARTPRRTRDDVGGGAEPPHCGGPIAEARRLPLERAGAADQACR